MSVLIRVGLVAATTTAVTAAALTTAANPAGADSPSCTWTVVNNPTPVYYTNWSFYDYKHTGDVVAGPDPDAIVSHDGLNYILLYLANGGHGYIDEAKVNANNCPI